MEKIYIILRGFFFWFFLFCFAICAPVVVLYSLGYRFNSQMRYFQRTGIISIKSIPQGAEVYLEDKNIKKFTPTVVREILPGEYKLRIEKEGFYPYQANIKVNPSCVSEVNIVLIPKIDDVEKISLADNFYKFFVLEHIFGKRIVAFAREAIYILNEELEEIARIAPFDLTEEEIGLIQGIKESRGNLVFWTPDNIWFIDSGGWGKKEFKIEHIYKARDTIKELFFVLKDKYLLLREGLKILILDFKNGGTFPIYELKDKDAQIYYDSYSDLLFIRDKVSITQGYSLFKINISKKIYEKTKD